MAFIFGQIEKVIVQLEVAPSRGPPDTLPLFSEKEPTSKPFNQQGRLRVVTVKESIGMDSFVTRHADRRK